jgi:protein involved in polysaccharide export with SLBB domain
MMKLKSYITSILILFISSCSLLNDLIPDVPLPKNLHIPVISDFKKIKRIIPGLNHSNSRSISDPKIAYNAGDRLAIGHTIKVEVFENSLAPKSIFSGTLVIEENGNAEIYGFGSISLVGQTLIQAKREIEAICARNRTTGRTLTAQIISVEDIPMVSIVGDVPRDVILPAYEKMTVESAIYYAGGRNKSSTCHSVYIIRGGSRKYFTNEHKANEFGFEPGDIIYLSSDI